MRRPFTNWAGLWLAVAVAVVVNLAPAAVNAQITFLNTWGSQGASNNQFTIPVSVAVGPTGTVYVVDQDNNRVQVFNSSGTYQSTIGTSSNGNPGSGNNQFNGPTGVAVGPDGTVYVADSDNERVQAFNSSGVYQSTIGGSQGVGNNQFDLPEGVATGSTGTVYVADDGNARVQVFNSAGVYQSTIGATGSPGTGNNQFNNPFGVAVGPTGTVYVSDPNNERVQVFNSSGVYQSTIGTSSNGNPGSGNNQFNYPEGVAVGPTGTVYVSDTYNNRVQVFNSSGTYQSTIGTSTFGNPGSGNNQFDFPFGVAVGSTGMVYVADTANNRIVRYFDPSSWVSGTNTFTDATVGPTSVTVGPGQIMGTSLTMTSAMGLVVGNNVTVGYGGTLTQAGGSITAPGLLIVVGSFTYQSGSLNADGGIAVVGFFQATQGGQLSASQGLGVGPSGAEMLMDGGTSLTTDTVSMQGGLMALGNATITVTTGAAFRFFGGEVQLQNANTAIINTPQLLNFAGLLDGSGRINGQVQNYLGAEVSVAAGQSMTITGAGNTNAGLMSLTGGTLHFTQDLTNSGSIEGIGTLRVDGGLTNGGSIILGGLGPAYMFGTINNSANLSLAGSAGVFGTVVNNASGGTIHLSGNTPNIFYSTVSNGGAINIDAGAIGLFYGGVTGSGTITNSGSAQFDATSTTSTVSGTGSTSLVSAATLNANTFAQGGLTVQLGGDTVGSYSKLEVAGALSLAGKLTVSLVNGFTPSLGNSFDLLDWGSLSGHFSSLSLPTLSAGLTWNTTQLYTTGTLAVIDSSFLPGDFNRDGHVDAADILPMIEALTNLSAYKATYAPNLTDAQVTLLGDIDGDTQFTNADLQALLNYLKDGGGSTDPVPEPASLALLGLGVLLIAFRRSVQSTAGSKTHQVDAHTSGLLECG